MGKRPHPRLRIDALTGEWRHGEAGEGWSSELCEPGGLRHQAGGASWRAPDQVAPRGRKASSTRKIKPQTSNRSRGRAAGVGTAPDTRRPSQRWQATPPWGRPPTTPAARSPHRACRPRGQCGPPHPHTRAHSTWVADPNSPPSGRAVGGGTAPDLRRPSQWWKGPPPGTPFRHPHSEQRRPARAHAVGPVLGPHARTDRTRDTRVAEPWLPAPEDGPPGEGQRLTPDAPHNGGRPPPLGTAPNHPRGTQPPQGMQAKGTVLGPHTRTPAPTARGWRTPTARPVGGQSGEGQLPDLRRPSQWWKAPPPGDALPPPPQRATPARKGARCGAGARSPRPHRPHPGHTGRGTLAARARCARHTTQGGGSGRRGSASAQTQKARGDYQKGNLTELAERTDRVEWRTSERG